jgi:hypothetical protein
LDNALAEDVVLVYSGTDASYYQLELSAANSWINTFHEKLFADFLKDIQYGFLVFDSPYISWSTPNFFFELAASDPFLDPERLISGLFCLCGNCHGTTLLLHVHCSHIAQK